MKRIVMLIMFCFLIVGCAAPESNPVEAEEAAVAVEKEMHPLADELPISERGFKIGVAGFVPRNFPDSGGADWTDFFDSLPETGELFGDYVAWDDDVDSSGMPSQIKTAVEVTSQKGMTPVIAVGFDQQMGRKKARSYFEKNGEAYKETVVKVAETYSPAYLALGVEVSRLHEESPEGFADFVKVYLEAYDAVKAVSPDTKVFTIFQLENMKGAARLTGRKHPPQWEIIEMFGDKLDLVGFTTYPYLEYESIDDIPADYYAEIAQYTSKPIAFTEMGWPTDSSIVPGDEDEQAEFLFVFLEGTQQLDVELVLWSFMHDIKHYAELGAAADIFDSIALKRNDGTEKKVYSYWQALRSVG